jgi:hypothetical protein
MISPSLEYLLARLDDLDQLHRDDASQIGCDGELQSFVREVFTHIGLIIRVQEIAERKRRHESLDLDALAEGNELATQILRQPRSQPPAAIAIDPNGLLKQLEQNLQALRKSHDDAEDPIRALARVSRMDWVFMQVAVYALSFGELPLALRDCVLKKIRLLPAHDLALLWSWINKELRGEDGIGSLDGISAAFETFPDLESAKGLIAGYIAIDKPRLLRARSLQGQTNYPLEVPGVAQVLGWTSPAELEHGSIAEEVFVQALVQATTHACTTYDLTANELAAHLQLTNANLLSNTQTLRAEVQQPGAFNRLRFQLRKLVRSADLLVTRDVPLTRHLLQYKLGLEILVAQHAREYSSKPETLLQKELCRFLIERNVMAVGTKFGSHETDLVTTNGGAQWVIEAKKITGSPTLSKFDRAIGQLRTYLDDHLGQAPFGILAIYNFTDCWISAPLERIGGRIQILAINLNKKHVSTRRRSIGIEPGNEGRLIRIVETGEVSPRATRGRRKKN